MEVGEQSAWDFFINGSVDYVNEWFLMKHPVTPSLIVAVYLLFVLKIGPAYYMKGKPAYSLRKVLIVYNALQVIFSGYVVFIGSRIFYKTGLWEKTCAMDNKEFAYLLTSGTYFYMMGKLSELLDTVFFVLRKKWNQITFLHVYHHSVMFVISWCSLKYVPSHNVVFIGTINSLVHTVMYTYYGLAAFPGLSKYLWWKKYITKMQLIQFTMMFVNTIIHFNTSVCPKSYLMVTAMFFNIIIFFFLFSKFYVDSYVKGNKKNDSITKKNSKSKSSFKQNLHENGHKISEKIR